MKDKKFWLMKSEPLEYSIDDLKNDKTEFWFGVRNYQVRNMFRDEMKIGDMALFYHSNAGKETGVVGVMKVIKAASADETQFDSKNKYYDAKSTIKNPRWLGVEVKFVKKLSRLVSLSEIKANQTFIDLPLVKQGNRLSVLPISEKQFNRLVELGDK